MAIKIIPEPDIFVTQREYEQYRQNWEASQKMTTRPVTLENFIRQTKLNEALYPSTYNQNTRGGIFDPDPGFF